MKWSESADYGFAIGRVRALEPLLFDRLRYERLAGAADPREFTSQMIDAGYNRFTGQGVGTNNAEELLATARDENDAFLVRYCRLPEVHTLFFLADDLSRLKVLLKQETTLQQSPRAVSHKPRGIWSPEQLHALASADGDAKPHELRLAVSRLLSNGEPAAPRTIDTALDVAAQRYLARVVEGLPFLRGLLALRSDVANLLALVRSKVLDEPTTDLVAEFLPGGQLDQRRLLEAHRADWDGLVATFRDTRYSEVVAAGVEFLREQRSLVRMERLAREEEIHFLRQTRYVSAGYEPVVAFCLQREAEITNLRLLYAAKLTGITAELCRELVAYVN
ncbi:MAG: V-type ATPase subunit [candidate division WOR-3 bacterium]